MEKSEIGSNKKEKIASAKPPLRPISSFQVLQKTTFGDAAGTSSSPHLAPNENIKVENTPTRNAVSSAVFVDSTSVLAQQFQAANSDWDPNLEQKILDPKLRRIISNRLSAQRSRLKKLKYLSNLEIQAKTFEDQVCELRAQLASYENQKQFLMLEQQTLHQEMEILQKRIWLGEAEISKNKGEVNRLRELQVMQQEQLPAQLHNLNIGGMLEPALSNYYTKSCQVAGNGVETSYIQPELCPMWIPADPNRHETNLTLPNYMESMETTPNPNFN